MRTLFDACTLGPLTVKNRFVRSATAEGRANKEGLLKDDVAPIYEALAAGGVGLIISGHMYVHPEWKCSPGQTGIWGDEHLPGLARLAQAAQTHGAHAVAQLNSATRPPHELSAAEIRETADAFVAAAERACAAGFRGVQIHAAHGYLLSAFLTPAANQRTDAYGGDGAGRRRLLVEVMERTRAAIGPDRALLCKLGVVDGRDNSLPLAESLETAQALAAAGVDGVEISTTFPGDHALPVVPGIDAPEKEAYFAPAARVLKGALSIPLILVGGLRSRVVMERLVLDRTCDFVSLSRPFIREPDLVNRLQSGAASRAACTSCNLCFGPRARGLRCGAL